MLGWGLAILGVVILGVAKSGFGGGVGIVAVPMFAIAFGAQRGTAILLPLLIAADIFSVYHHWGTWDKKVLKTLTPGTLVGIAVGSVMLWVIVVGWIWPWNFDWSQWHKQAVSGAGLTQQAKAVKENSAEALNLVTGVVSVLYVLLDQVRLRVAPKWHFKPNAKTGFVAGGAVGVISTLAHAAGPVAAIFLLNQGLPRAVFMGTTVIYFFGINVVKLVPYTAIPGLINWDSVRVGLLLCMFAPLGTSLGAWLCKRMSERFFRSTILVITFVTGLQLVVEWATGVKLVQLVAGWF